MIIDLLLAKRRYFHHFLVIKALMIVILSLALWAIIAAVGISVLHATLWGPP